MQVRPAMADNASSAVEKDGVAFESHAAFGMIHGKRVQVGYDITLYGAHDGEHEVKDGESVCHGCAEVWDNLRAIAAEAVTKAGNDDELYRVEPFRPGVTLSRNRKGADGQSREDVQFVLEIRRNAPITDEGEKQEKEQMVQPLIDSLREMGVREGA